MEWIDYNGYKINSPRITLNRYNSNTTLDSSMYKYIEITSNRIYNNEKYFN